MTLGRLGITGNSSAIVGRLAVADNSSGGGFLSSAGVSGGKPHFRRDLRLPLERLEEADSLSEETESPEDFLIDFDVAEVLRADLRCFDAVVEAAASRAVPLPSP